MLYLPKNFSITPELTWVSIVEYSIATAGRRQYDLFGAPEKQQGWADLANPLRLQHFSSVKTDTRLYTLQALAHVRTHPHTYTLPSTQNTDPEEHIEPFCVRHCFLKNMAVKHQEKKSDPSPSPLDNNKQYRVVFLAEWMILRVFVNLYIIHVSVSGLHKHDYKLLCRFAADFWVCVCVGDKTSCG